MANDETGNKGARSGIKTEDIEAELHRLRESQMRLLLMAEELGITVPRSCCLHPGKRACASCSADWLAANAHRLVRPKESE